MKSGDYKPQIDGLRALAVLPVVFFHAGFSFFQGGFIGVDIFFVISGYLITTIILREITSNKFNLTNFYIRRSRRILPVLYFITFLTIPFSLFLMSSEELNFFSREIISVIFFASNFFFWKNTGYFSPDSDLQPLLHTWSLGVEEQFYIFFPLFLIFVYKFFKNKIVLLVSCIFFLSLLMSQVGGNFKIQNLSLQSPYLFLPFEFFWQAGSANFYLPFGRIWELMSGSLTAIYLFKKEVEEKKINNYISVFGLILIICSIIFFNKNLQYPSVFTLLPVIGTVLIIIFTTKLTILNKVLSIKPLVFSGLISYSLYLWHQPILAFNRIYFNSDLTALHSLLIIALSIVLSFVTWKYVEQPFRKRTVINDKNVILSLVILALTILFISFLIYFEKIKSNKDLLPQKIINSFKSESGKDCFDIDYAHINSKDKWFCELGSSGKSISFAVIGDSHALSLKPGFHDAASENNIKGIFTGYSGCVSFLDIYSIRAEKNIKNCKMLNEKLFKFIKKNKIKKIFLVSRWTYYTDGNYEKTNFSHISKTNSLSSNKKNSRLAFTFGLENTVKRYNNLGVEVIFVHQVPLQVFSPSFVYSKSFNKKINEINIKKLSNLSVNFDKHMSIQEFVRKNTNIIKNKNYNFKEIDLNNYFCDNKKCKIGEKDASFYSDRSHLSIIGAKLIKNKIKQYLD